MLCDDVVSCDVWLQDERKGAVNYFTLLRYVFTFHFT
jgi:hypothetical protein